MPLEKENSALLIVGHGSTLNSDSSVPTHRHADAIRSQRIFREVAACFWKEEPSMREVLRMIDSDEIYIVPNFISEGYFTQTVIPRELELAGRVTFRNGRTLKYCDPVGSHERMTSVLLHRAREAAPDCQPSETSLIIAAHGTDLNENSARAAKHQVRRIREMALYGEVISAYMEEAPSIADWHSITSRPNVVVVPFFISDGLHSFIDIPALMGISGTNDPGTSQADVFRGNPRCLRGRNLYYASAVGTDPMIAGVILDQVEAFDARVAQSDGMLTVPGH